MKRHILPGALAFAALVALGAFVAFATSSDTVLHGGDSVHLTCQGKRLTTSRINTNEITGELRREQHAHSHAEAANGNSHEVRLGYADEGRNGHAHRDRHADWRQHRLESRRLPGVPCEQRLEPGH